MSVSDSDLRSWTTPGAQTSATATYHSVKAALDASPEMRRLNWVAFLQGSYANATNTRGDSDVDIVVMLTETFYADLQLLGSDARAREATSRSPVVTSAATFRAVVHRALDAYYGPSLVAAKNKCLRVAKQPGYVDADVVPCLQVRRYRTFNSNAGSDYIEGISIEPLTGGRIVNFPKEHLANGEAKSRATGSAYKPTVRQVKRLRRRAVDLGLLSPTDASGYLLECLVFNGPTPIFQGTDAHRVRRVVYWLDEHSAEDLASTMWSCDEIHALFQNDPGDHNQYTAKRVMSTLAGML